MCDHRQVLKTNGLPTLTLKVIHMFAETKWQNDL